MERLWKKTNTALFTQFASAPHGLTNHEASARLQQYGENKLQEIKRKGILQVFLEPVSYTHLTLPTMAVV